MSGTASREKRGRPSGPLILARGVEFVVLFFGVPSALAARRLSIPIIPALLLACVFCLVLLWTDRGFSRRDLWNAAGVRPGLRRVLVVFVVAGGLLTGAVLVGQSRGFVSLLRVHPALASVVRRAHPLVGRRIFLGFARERTGLWALVMVLYPLLSVWPQEVIFRAFLFHRYRVLFPRPRVMVCASAVCFGYAHVVFLNWPAVVLCAVGGWLFASTYERTRSLLLTSIEHSLYGDLAFTIGLGFYLYGGSTEFVRHLAG